MTANFQGADLLGTDLRRAKLRGARLRGALANFSTRWPKGFDVEAEGIRIMSD
jgi:uncharacterized protein YjbI with pentapeptide repeats